MTQMRAAFRVDASIDMGTGHVMRCLTLADALRERGAECRFICRAHAGNLNDKICDHGHTVVALPFSPDDEPAPAPITADVPAHACWLGTDWATDARQTAEALGDAPVDWLIVDHYAIDARWEHQLRPACRRLMVIDDLADRPHDCDLLLDQTFGRAETDYHPWVPPECQLMCGSRYALLRPEFAAMRPYSLQRRAPPTLRELLITMGGVDKDNKTEQILQELRTCPLPAGCRITVVLGATAPCLNEVRKQAQDMRWTTRVLIGVTKMAQIMADSDLAIGAAGATSWERCCLGLPTIMVVLSANQLKVAQGLQEAGAAVLVDMEPRNEHRFAELLGQLLSDPEKLRSMCESAADIVDGIGTISVVARLES
jgi:UDP-2,4-diacetamido-2,4,6-trideoxy-beta-L-altropyranose hydrolase